MARIVTNKGPVQSGTMLNLLLKQKALRKFECQGKQKANVARGIQPSRLSRNNTNNIS